MKLILKCIAILFILITIQSCVKPNKIKPVNINRFSLDVKTDPDDFLVGNENFTKRTHKYVKVKGIEKVPQYIESGRLPKRMGSISQKGFNLPHEKLKISVKDIPLNKFIHVVFGEILKLNYTVDESISKRKDKVTLRMDKKISSKKFFATIENILSSYNISLANKDGVVFVKSGKQKSKQRLDYKISFGKKFQFDNLPSNEIVYQILPINFLKLDKAREIAMSFALSKSEGRIYIMDNVNALLIKDYVSNIRKIINLISVLDHPYMKDKTFRLVYLENIDVKKFYDRIKQIFDMMNISIGTNVKQEPITLMPIEEINALLVVTDKKDLLKTLLYWKDKLDNLEDLGDNKQIFVYKTKNREAKEINTILAKLLTEINKQKKEEKKDKNLLKRKQIASSTKIVVDEKRNMLIFYMYPSEYKKVHRLLQKIDTKAQQILIEVTIAEITLIDKLQYGLEWYLQNNPESKTHFSLQTLSGLGLGSGGLSGVVTSHNIQALFNTFAQDNLLNILSSPKMVVLNNQSASFNVGTQVPIITSQTTAKDVGSDTNGKPTFVQNVTYRNTGISTSIKPTITANNTIMLKINQTVSEAQNNNTSNISSPIIVNRSISTSVLLKNGEELIIGGLIKENKSKTNSKVPLLGDIPIMGKLFKTSSNTKDRTELVIVVKPYILNKKEDVDSLCDAFKKITKFNSDNL